MTVQELLSEIGVDYLENGHQHCRRGWIQLRNCPFCGSQNYHLGYSLQRKGFWCWRCRFHLTKEVLPRLGATAEQLARFWGAEGKAQGKAVATKPRAELREPEWRGPLLDCHKEYLRYRGFDPEEIERIWEVEGIGLAPRLCWRLYIPVIVNGQRVSWTTRSISHTNPKRYMSAPENCEGLSIKQCLYGHDYVRHSVVVVEGPTDTWNIGPGCVGLLGTGFTIEQVCKLSKIPQRYIVFDNSKQAQRRAMELCEQLKMFPGVTERIQLDAEDPGTATAKEVATLRRVCNI